MSDKRLLDKYVGRTTGREKETNAPSEQEETIDSGAFGVLRGIQERSTMIELRKKSGTIMAIAYSWLERMEYNPSDGITLHCGTRLTVRIKGQNLNSEVRPMVRLFSALARHKVSFIAESKQSQVLQAPKDAILVTSLEWE